MPALVLLPGLLCDADAWKHQIARLHNQFQIIVPDFDQTDTPDKMVQTVLQAAPAQFLLAGHSMGGWIALEIMKVAPERVSKLCLANTTAKSDSPAKAAARRDMIANAQQGNMAAVIDKLAAAFVHRKEYLPAVKQMMERHAEAFIHQERAMLMRIETETVLHTITCPTLVIHADCDAVFSADDSKQLAETIRYARLAVISNAGHMSPIEQAEQFTAAMLGWI